MNVKRFDSSEGNVWKYVFDFDDAIAESVLYKYKSFEERTVLCISVQSGCPVGCKFCGTGNKFIRNLTTQEIIEQVYYCLKEKQIEEVVKYAGRFQIMFMSMGEPLFNFLEVHKAIIKLNTIYPHAELLISTMAPDVEKYTYVELCHLCIHIDKVGLQFSVHDGNEEQRNKLIPLAKKFTLRQIRDYGIIWSLNTKRPVYINYCVSQNNSSVETLNRLMDLFPPQYFYFTFSVICSADENMKDAGYRNLEVIGKVSQFFLENNYNVRVFDPAGQDDIGGGCGQLWYVQEWIKKNKR